MPFPSTLLFLNQIAQHRQPSRSPPSPRVTQERGEMNVGEIAVHISILLAKDRKEAGGRGKGAPSC